jgi:hypothetical protein
MYKCTWPFHIQEPSWRLVITSDLIKGSIFTFFYAKLRSAEPLTDAWSPLIYITTLLS